jgi:hypothetical protein
MNLGLGTFGEKKRRWKISRYRPFKESPMYMNLSDNVCTFATNRSGYYMYIHLCGLPAPFGLHGP